ATYAGDFDLRLDNSRQYPDFTQSLANSLTDSAGVLDQNPKPHLVASSWAFTCSLVSTAVSSCFSSNFSSATSMMLAAISSKIKDVRITLRAGLCYLRTKL
ncbi:hypothetical protein AAMO2058_001466100, partial [Amorphochlora amoebiformis]